MRINDCVTDLCDLVYEDHYVSLENLCCVSEVSNVTESVNAHDFLARNDHVNELWVLNNFGDDFCSCLAKTHS